VAYFLGPPCIPRRFIVAYETVCHVPIPTPVYFRALDKFNLAAYRFVPNRPIMRAIRHTRKVGYNSGNVTCWGCAGFCHCAVWGMTAWHSWSDSAARTCWLSN